MNQSISHTPEPPYYAVVFTSLRTAGGAGYGSMADAMDALAAEQDGYLGHDSARGSNGVGITVSYWRDAAAVEAWKENARHLVAQTLGSERWYEAYRVRVARVERAYSGPRR